MAARRVAWVTGASKGIGRACALALAEAGCDVALTARTPADLRSAAEACRKVEARALEVPCDVTDPAQVQQAHRRIAEGLGPVDVLVNGAGIARSAPFLKSQAADWEVHWRLNVLGVVHCTQAALPGMLERGAGRVVNVASVAGLAGAPYITAYAASKHALVGLTRSLAAEVAARGVTVNAVCPGYVDTPMTRDNLDRMAQVTGRPREELLRHIEAQSPQRRLFTPEEVAAAVVYLASPGARGVTGQCLTLDGGASPW